MTLHHDNSRPDRPRHRGDNPLHNYETYYSEGPESDDDSQSRFRALTTRLLILAGFLSAILILPTAVRAQDQEPRLASESTVATATREATSNLLVNGEFSGQTGWTNCAGAEDSTWDIAEDHLRVLGSGPACAYQTVRATTSATYQLRCESYEEAPEQRTLIRLSVLDENWQTLDEAATSVAVGSSVATLAATVGSGAAHIGVTVDSPGVAYSSYGYCELTPSASNGDGQSGDGASGGGDRPGGDGDTNDPSDPPSGNLLVNGDFAAAAGWDNCDSTANQPTIEGQLIITASASSPACIYQEVAVGPFNADPSDSQDRDRTFELSCASTVSTGYASLTVNALNSAYANLASEISDGADLGQPIVLIAPPDTSIVAVTFYGEGFSTHDNCVLTTAGSPTDPNPDPETPQPGGEVTVTAENFSGYRWNSLSPGTAVNLVGDFRSGIVLDQRHSGLVFDGGHSIDGADGWVSGAVFDGTGYNTGASHPGAIRIDGAKDITVRNFKIGNYASQTISTDPKAIYVLGDSANVAIETNEIFGFTSVHQADCHTANLVSLERCGTAHGILVATWDSPSTTIVGIGVYGNRIYNMDLGKSEALTVVGNVRDFNIKYNQVYNVNNIAIDVAGFARDGVFYTTSNGVVEGNTVYKVDTRGNQGLADAVPSNQAYLNLETGQNNQSAACIYVDGGRDVVVLANRVHQCNIGISINGETKTATASGSTSAQDVIVEGNLVYGSSTTGFKLGSGSDEQGGVDRCDIRNNDFYTNDATEEQADVYHDGLGEIWIENAVRNCIIRDNDFLANGLRPEAGPGGSKTVFANTVLSPGPGTFVFTNNRFYYTGEPSDDVARCQWITFANEPVSQCLANLNGGGGGGNTYTPVVRPEPLELPAPVGY